MKHLIFHNHFDNVFKRHSKLAGQQYLPCDRDWVEYGKIKIEE